MSEVAAGVLRRCLAVLHAFECPSYHRPSYDRTEAVLEFLLEPSNLPKLVFVRDATLAPVCADLIPDSGVAFLGGIGPRPADAPDLEFDDWRPLAAEAPVIFVRLGKSVQRHDGRWAWALLDDVHLMFAFDSPNDARLDQLLHLRSGAVRA